MREAFDVNGLGDYKEIKVIGYYVSRDASPYVVLPEDVFVAFIDEKRGFVEGYCPAEGHLSLSSEYLSECREISLNSFKRLSKGHHLPTEYLLKGDEKNVGIEI